MSKIKLTNGKITAKILTMHKAKEFFTVQEIAKKLGLSRQAIDKRIVSRKITFETYGRTRLIPKTELEKVTK